MTVGADFTYGQVTLTSTSGTISIGSRVDSASELLIKRNRSGTITTDTSWSVTGLGSNAGCTVTVAGESGDVFTALRNMPHTQTEQYAYGGDFPADTAQGIADRQVMELQQLREEISRSIRLPDTATAAQRSAIAVTAADAGKVPTITSTGGFSYETPASSGGAETVYASTSAMKAAASVVVGAQAAVTGQAHKFQYEVDPGGWTTEGIFFASATSGYRWRRLFDGPIIITWLADNDYDPDDDSGGAREIGAALNEAVGYIDGLNDNAIGGTIYIPEGVYRQTTRFVLDVNEVSILCSGLAWIHPTGSSFTELVLTDLATGWDTDILDEIVAGQSAELISRYGAATQATAKTWMLTCTPMWEITAKGFHIENIRLKAFGSADPTDDDLSGFVIHQSGSTSSGPGKMFNCQASYLSGYGMVCHYFELVTFENCWWFDNGRAPWVWRTFVCLFIGGRSHCRYGIAPRFGDTYSTWAISTAYVAGDKVVNSSVYYECISNHTSDASAFSNDYDANNSANSKWRKDTTCVDGFKRGLYLMDARNTTLINFECLGFPIGQVSAYSGIYLNAQNVNTENQNQPIDYSATYKGGNRFKGLDVLNWNGGHFSKLANAFTIDSVPYARISGCYIFDVTMDPWRDGLSVSDGDFVVNTSGEVYSCTVTSEPQTVGTMPTHTSSSAADAGNGNITYVWVRSGYFFITASGSSNIDFDTPIYSETSPAYDGLWFKDSDGTCTLKRHPEAIRQVGNSEIVFSGVVTPSDITSKTTYHHVGIIPAGYEIEEFTLRLNGPVWQSDAKYWETAVTSVDTGDYVITVDGRLYLCAVTSGPQTVATKPTHTSGDAADAGNANITYTFQRTSSEFSLFVAPAYFKEASTTSNLSYTADALVRCSLDNNLGSFKVDEIGSEAAGIFYSGYTSLTDGAFVITSAGRIYKASVSSAPQVVDTEPTHTTVGGTVPDAGNANITHYEYYGPFYGKFSDAANNAVNGVIYGYGSTVYADTGISGILPASSSRNGKIIGARFSEPRRLWWRWGNSDGIDSGELHWKLRLRSADF